MKRGVSAESPSAALNLFIAAFRLRSKSTKVSADQSFFSSSSRVTSSPGRASSMERISTGCPCSRILIPCFRSSPDCGSNSKSPNRIDSVGTEGPPMSESSYTRLSRARVISSCNSQQRKQLSFHIRLVRKALR